MRTAERASSDPTPQIPVNKTPVEGRGPALVMLWEDGRVRAWPRWPNNPLRKLASRPQLFAVAERRGETGWSGESANRSRGDVPGSPGGSDLLEACMRREKTIGKPCAGNPHARFERGPQETEPQGRGA